MKNDDLETPIRPETKKYPDAPLPAPSKFHETNRQEDKLNQMRIEENRLDNTPIEEVNMSSTVQNILIFAAILLVVSLIYYNYFSEPNEPAPEPNAAVSASKPTTGPANPSDQNTNRNQPSQNNPATVM